jgi:hypothetical protein
MGVLHCFSEDGVNNLEVKTTLRLHLVFFLLPPAGLGDRCVARLLLIAEQGEASRLRHLLPPRASL